MAYERAATVAPLRGMRLPGQTLRVGHRAVHIEEGMLLGQHPDRVVLRQDERADRVDGLHDP